MQHFDFHYLKTRNFFVRDEFSTDSPLCVLSFCHWQNVGWPWSPVTNVFNKKNVFFLLFRVCLTLHCSRCFLISVWVTSNKFKNDKVARLHNTATLVGSRRQYGEEHRNEINQAHTVAILIYRAGDLCIFLFEFAETNANRKERLGEEMCGNWMFTTRTRYSPRAVTVASCRPHKSSSTRVRCICRAFTYFDSIIYDVTPRAMFTFFTNATSFRISYIISIHIYG